MHSEQRNLIEGEWRVSHENGEMRIKSVLVVADDSVPFGEYVFD
jgi:hypothetical protein